ncbi:MAG TPA: hypothetical protein PK624_10465 [Spirochaetota bacterium]|nr:hypothetical protein [Spirochaetota bacterium]HOR45205.1 hypothetical protein [Spirochaetota bacterium]HOU84859.1 hypothetical protein [Spirochaetota bacterium]HPK56915.1 hypothetical protein [Spirochaetota bacterium]
MKRIKQILDTAIRIAAAFYLMQNFTALFSPESEIRMTRVYGILPEEFLALFVFLSSGLFTSCGLFVFLSAKRKAAFFLSSIILFAGIISKIYSVAANKYNSCGCSNNGGDLTYLAIITAIDAAVLFTLIYLYQKGKDISFIPKRKII